MTRRERLEMVIAQNITEELIEECKAELEKLDKRNAERAQKVTPHQIENDKIAEAIVAILTDATEPMQIDPLVEMVAQTTNLADLKRQRVQGVCINLIKAEVLKSEDVKVKGKGKRKAYSLA